MQRRWVLALPAVLLVLVGPGVAQKDKNDTTKTTSKKSRPLVDTKGFMTEYDANKDGSLSKDEIPDWLKHNFARLDTNKDGKISKDELEKGAAWLHQRRRPSDVVFVLIEMSDCDECCAEELERIYTALRTMDKNKDGKIDTDELKAGRTTIVKDRVDRLFKRLDTDKDGKISKKEARGRVKEFFAALDTNKDGYVDRKELTTAAEAKPEKKTDKPDPDKK